MSRAPRVAIPGSLAVVTGAGSGIGKATALALAAEGAAVVAVDIDEAAAELTAKECSVVGPEAHARRCDVSDRDAMLALAAAVHDDHGPVGVLVNNAGVGMSGRFLDTELEDWDWIVGINLLGVVHGCHAFGPAMVAAGRGHVVNISSGLGFTPRATEPAYVTTKAAVLALSRCLRADWHDHGVGVSAICPGVIDTAIIRATRFRGSRAGADQVANVQKVFSRGHPPQLVAAAVVDAVRRDRSVVPVGVEARLGWALHRLLPLRAGDRMARASVGGV
ncbi:MAG: SDR family NAD(P)-dependent oxidoreductase [Acidimicrobiales bacterium]